MIARYSVDTSALIDAYYRTYTPNVFVSFWRYLTDLASRGVVVASEEVWQELAKKRESELTKWAKSVPGMFQRTDSEVQTTVHDVLSAYPNLVQANSAKSKADPFVIALAKVRVCAVLTCEQATGNLQGPKIPDVCRALGIRLVTFSQMLHEQGITI